MNSSIKFYYWKNILAGIFIITVSLLLASWIICSIHERRNKNRETVYLLQIKKDFLHHKQDVETIYRINKKIFTLADSLLRIPADSKMDSSPVFLKLMNTRPYDLTVMAYANILNNNVIRDDALKLEIATHVARFEGLAKSKLMSIDWQWDKTARPYIYAHGIEVGNTKNILTDPLFRDVLFDRKMFANDVSIITPGILASIDSVVVGIDKDLKK